MLTVSYQIAQSDIHGIGVFSLVAIKKGDIVWRFHPVIDREIPAEAIYDLPETTRQVIMNHASFIPDRDVFVLGCDGDYFMNHSDNPTLEDDGEFMFASRDIAAGEELTCDYRVVMVLGYDPMANGPHEMQANFMDPSWRPTHYGAPATH
jgi:SET domain-containing protein